MGSGDVRACEGALAKARGWHSCVPQAMSAMPPWEDRTLATRSTDEAHKQRDGGSDEAAPHVAEALPRSAAPHARLAHARQYGQSRSHHAVWEPIFDRALRSRESRRPPPRLDHRRARQPTHCKEAAARLGGEAHGDDFGAVKSAGQEPCMLVPAT